MEAFRRVGRGGAGNFYSKQDIQEAEKASNADLEAQTQISTTQDHQPQLHTTGPSYAHTGRGGAGNYTPSTTSSAATAPLPTSDPTLDTITRTTTATAAQEATAEAERTQAAAQAAAAARSKAKAGGLSGRGGAGNWTDGGSGDAGKDEEEEQRKVVEEELQREVLRDVEMGLAVPARVYRGGR